MLNAEYALSLCVGGYEVIARVRAGGLNLTKRCLENDAIVVDHLGARYYPRDIKGEHEDAHHFEIARKARLKDAYAKHDEIGAENVILDSAEFALKLIARWLTV